MSAMPGLSCLRSFMAAIECGSYSKAAENLEVTHTAIIQHVKSLERQVGAQLMVRDGGVLRASEKGAEIYLRIKDSVRALEGAFSTRPEPVGQRFVIATVPSFANGWLLPRMHKLINRFPGIEFVIDAKLALEDISRTGADISIRLGNEGSCADEAAPLFSDFAFPVASASSPGATSVCSPSDLLRMPLIENPLLPWSAWFEANNVTTTGLKFALVVSDTYSAQLAAESAIGIALGRLSLAQHCLNAKRLILPVPKSTNIDATWWLVRGRGRSSNKRLLESICTTLMNLARPSHAQHQMGPLSTPTSISARRSPYAGSTACELAI